MFPHVYKTNSLHKIFRRSQITIFIITFFICSFTFVLISTFTMKTYVHQNLNILSTTLSERIQPALVFKDTHTVAHILNEYTTQHSIRNIRVYDENNHEIAHSIKQTDYYSKLQDIVDHLFLKDAFKINIQHQQHQVGHLVMYGSSEKILQFIITILISLAVVMFFMIFAIWWSTNSTYRYIMQAIRPLTAIAQLISDHKAYSLRFPPNDIKEFQDLNEVFNQLLKEIQSWHTHLQLENNQLSFAARHDHLTTLPNRSYFYQRLVNIFENPSTRENSVLIFIDNNHFKKINDTYGHLAGDAVLKEMSIRLKQRIRHEDFIARLGGDEFAILLESVQHVDHIQTIVENLLESSNTPLQFNDVSISFGFSIGVAFSKSASTPEELITQADQAMYKAKKLNQQWFIHQP